MKTTRVKKSKVEAILRSEATKARIEAEKEELKRTCQTRAKIWLDEHGYSIKITELSGMLFFHYLASVCPHFGLDLSIHEYGGKSCYLRIYDYRNDNNFNSISLYNNEFISWNSDNIADKNHWAHLKDELVLRGLRLEIAQTQVPVSSLFPELTQTVSELTWSIC